MQVGFDNGTGQLTLVFEADELREAQKIVEMFHGESPELDQIERLVDGWVKLMERRQ